MNARASELLRVMPFKAPADMSKFLLSPMPGLLASVAVAEGQEIKAGEALAVVEAMKMENVLRATRDGTVKCFNCHTFCQNDPNRFLLQVRGKYEGMVLVENGKVRRINARSLRPCCTSSCGCASTWISWSSSCAVKLLRCPGSPRAPDPANPLEKMLKPDKDQDQAAARQSP